MSGPYALDGAVNCPAIHLDGRTFLARALLASASTQAELALVEIRVLAADGDPTSEKLAAHMKARGTALMDLWSDLMVCTGQDREPWAREAALRAVRAYVARLDDLLAASTEGGWS